MKEGELVLTEEWNKVFPKNENAHSRYFRNMII